MPRITIIDRNRQLIKGEVRTLKELPEEDFTLSLKLKDGRTRAFTDLDIFAIRVESGCLTCRSGIVRQGIEKGLQTVEGIPGFYFPLNAKINVIFPNMEKHPKSGNA